MVYQVIWTAKAIETYISNIEYLESAWTEREVKKFMHDVEKKIKLLSAQPLTGSEKSKKQPQIRHTLIHKRVSLIYRIASRKKQVELLLFWNTYQNPKKLTIR